MSRYADVLDALEPLSELKPTVSVKDRSTGFTLTQAEAFAMFNALDGDVYLATRLVKPILLRQEQASTDGSAIYDYSTISVEHVCPQTLPDNSQWAEWFSDLEAHSSWLHTLGNLVLLNFRKNAAARNFEFDVKKSQYFAPGNSSAFTLTNGVRAYSTWMPSDIRKRREILLRRLAKDWRLDDTFERWWIAQ